MNRIPKMTTRRYPSYLRTLRNLRANGLKRIKSDVLSQEMKIKATTVRRDLSYLGHLGRQGYGYDIEGLIQRFAAEVETAEGEKIVLFGLGNLGRALMKYNYFPLHVGQIVCVFETDILKTGQYQGIPVYHVSELLTKFPRDATIAVIATPGNEVQHMVDVLTKLGVRGFVNFSDARLKVRSSVVLRNIDLGEVIQDVIYKLKAMEE